MLILFDRDATLIEDVPYNGDPRLVRTRPTAVTAVALARRSGCHVGMVTNQSGVARGLLTHGEVDAVNRRVEELLGPFDVVRYCPHGPEDHCSCRKPRPGMVLAAARHLAVPLEATVVIGDTGADIEAAERAGAAGVLVPVPRTLPREVQAARHVAPDLVTAVRMVLGGVVARTRAQVNA